ncbi:RIP metalloprotease RseP [Campylobacter portucalensis]|uniref:RIP metalloprotease RseP n=1 Tax=Campylobacter portucalensis TaxID=2608384 RepID=UPI002DDB1009|nr:RIP metalloprotease RseP [Campylobacter portucalensis]
MNSIIAISILTLGLLHWGASFFITILIISFLIFFHELGHFLAAKHMGVAVETFSVGFGEKLYTKRINGTDYSISAIPLGGYVKMKGQDDADPTLKNYDKDSYNSLTPIKRIYILFAGPFFNLVLAFFIYISLGYIGVEKLAPKIGTILDNSAASLSNLKQNDEILSIDGIKVKEWDDISKLVEIKPLNLEILRNGKVINTTLTPKIGKSKTIFGEDIQKPLIGISPSGEFVTIYNKGFSSITYAFSETIKASTLIIKSLEKIVTGVVSAKEMGGIIAITDITTKAASISISVLLILTALISVNLGVINLLPIPVLDGGHIVFNLYEIIFKKPVNEKIFTYLSYMGMALLASLMVFTIVNDILRMTGFYN